MVEASRDSLLLDLIQKVAKLQASVDALVKDGIHEDFNDMRVTVAKLEQSIARLIPIVDRLDQHSQQAVGVMWFGRVIWAVIGGAVLTAAGWIAHKLGLG